MLSFEKLLLNEAAGKFASEVKEHLLSKLKAAKAERDWDKLPESFQREAVKFQYNKIRPYFSKDMIMARVNASKAPDFDDLIEIIEKN